MFKRRHPSQSIAQDEPSSSSEEDDQRLNPFQEEEEDQERALSERHGEAKENGPPPNPTSKKESDKDIANALNSNETKKKRKRITLTEDKLTDGVNGIIRIRHEFPSKIRYRPLANAASTKKMPKKKKLELEIQAAAAYSSKLLTMYNNFAMDLMPTFHPTDTLLKINDLGSKKKVRNYLDLMRQDTCMSHLKTVYGMEKATKLFDELNHGLRAHENGLFPDMNTDDGQNSTDDRDENNQEKSTLGQQSGKPTNDGDKDNAAQAGKLQFDDEYGPSLNSRDGNNAAKLGQEQSTAQNQQVNKSTTDKNLAITADDEENEFGDDNNEVNDPESQNNNAETDGVEHMSDMILRDENICGDDDKDERATQKELDSTQKPYEAPEIEMSQFSEAEDFTLDNKAQSIDTEHEPSILEKTQQDVSSILDIESNLVPDLTQPMTAPKPGNKMLSQDY